MLNLLKLDYYKYSQADDDVTSSCEEVRRTNLSQYAPPINGTTAEVTGDNTRFYGGCPAPPGHEVCCQQGGGTNFTNTPLLVDGATLNHLDVDYYNDDNDVNWEDRDATPIDGRCNLIVTAGTVDSWRSEARPLLPALSPQQQLEL